MGMIGEEATDDTDLVADKESKSQTDKAGANHEAAIEPREFVSREGKRQRQGGGDQHHPGDGADAENQQVEDRPFRIVNGAKYEQGDGGGTGEAVNDAYEQRAQDMK